MNYLRQRGLGLQKGDRSVCVLSQLACVPGTEEAKEQRKSGGGGTQVLDCGTWLKH